MADLLVTAIITFAATNIDDILILALFFSQVSATFRPRHVVAGQYLGFAVLVSISLVGFLGGLVVPRPWIGLLGLAPILIGLHKFLGRNKTAEPPQLKSQSQQPPNPPIFSALLDPKIYQVALITVANGGDNIGIYTPLFATSSLSDLTVLLGVFFVLLGLWCFVGYRLTHRSAVVTLMTRYGHIVVPIVLVGLGLFILLESGTHTLFGQ